MTAPKVKDEAELARLGAGLDPNNPGQAIPLDEISRIGKSQSYEGFTLVALLALASTLWQALLSAEVSVARQYWEIGNVLRAIRKQHHEREKVKPRNERQGWMKFVAAQGWNQKKVDKALRIRRENPTADSVDDKTVDVALNYAMEDGPDGNPGHTYIFDDGRVVYYGSYGYHAYFWDGKVIEFGVTLHWNECADWQALEPPTEAQLETALAAYKATLPDEEQEEEQEQDDQSHGSDCECNTCHNKRKALAHVARRERKSAEPNVHVTPEPEPEPAKPSWDVHYTLTGVVCVEADTEKEARHWMEHDPAWQDWIKQSDLTLSINAVERRNADGEPEAKPKPKARKRKTAGGRG